MRRNSEWFDAMGFEDVLRLAARMTVARMVERDTFQKRMAAAEPIGIHEFLYPLMQGWDSVMIRCDVELGGTDQLFNLLVGRDLQREEGQRRPGVPDAAADQRPRRAQDEQVLRQRRRP